MLADDLYDLIQSVHADVFDFNIVEIRRNFSTLNTLWKNYQSLKSYSLGET